MTICTERSRKNIVKLAKVTALDFPFAPIDEDMTQWNFDIGN
jgi:hypothetical protein